MNESVVRYIQVCIVAILLGLGIMFPVMDGRWDIGCFFLIIGSIVMSVEFYYVEEG